MKIILLKDVRKVGRKDEIKDVADGYAINFLLRQNLAVAASADKLAAHERQQAELQAQLTAKAAEIDRSILDLNGTRIEIPVRATPKGGLFKSLGIADIARAIEGGRKVAIASQHIRLDEPIKSLGEHRILIASERSRAEITVAVLPAV